MGDRRRIRIDVTREEDVDELLIEHGPYDPKTLENFSYGQKIELLVDLAQDKWG